MILSIFVIDMDILTVGIVKGPVVYLRDFRSSRVSAEPLAKGAYMENFIRPRCDAFDNQSSIQSQPSSGYFAQNVVASSAGVGIVIFTCNEAVLSLLR